MRASTQVIRVGLCFVLPLAGLVVSSSRTGVGQTAHPHFVAPECDEPSCDAVTRGRLAFSQRHLAGLKGNGRSCADCHVEADGFQLSPATARARFERLVEVRTTNPQADDPLFRPVDADDFRERGQTANHYSNLVDNGLVRVTMTLPANVRLIDPATCPTPDPVACQPTKETEADLWRAVMPLLDVGITGPDGVAPAYPPDAGRVPIMGQGTAGPNVRGGYQADARFGTLQEQARSALISHAQVTTEPSEQLLDDLAAFQQTLFSSGRVRQLARALPSGASFLDPDPPLDAFEQAGRTVFNRACAQCHGGTLHPSTSTSDATLPGIRPLARYHTIFSGCPRPNIDGFAPCRPELERNARIYRITRADGTFQFATTSDPGRLLLTGQPNDLNVFDVTNLRGIGRTAPYFHNNSAATLEDVLDHYDAFFKNVARRNPPPSLPPNLSSNGRDIDRGFVRTEERQALIAYLKKL